jgi:hypothetical protein
MRKAPLAAGALSIDGLLIRFCRGGWLPQLPP